MAEPHHWDVSAEMTQQPPHRRRVSRYGNGISTTRGQQQVTLENSSTGVFNLMLFDSCQEVFLVLLSALVPGIPQQPQVCECRAYNQADNTVWLRRGFARYQKDLWSIKRAHISLWHAPCRAFMHGQRRRSSNLTSRMTNDCTSLAHWTTVVKTASSISHFHHCMWLKYIPVPKKGYNHSMSIYWNHTSKPHTLANTLVFCNKLAEGCYISAYVLDQIYNIAVLRVLSSQRPSTP